MMTKEEIHENYLKAKNTPSDINEHLEVLLEYANKCDHITEFGVRGVVSTWAFLESKASKVVCVDILNVAVPEVEKMQFICADDLQIEIEPTDLLMIDTAHNYDQCIKELNLHAKKVNRFICLHDISIFGVHGDDGGKGLLFAINEFLLNNPQWMVCYRNEANNGLMVLEKTWLHFYKEILGFASEDEQGELLYTLLSFIPNNNLKIAEVGVYRGRGTALWNIILLQQNISYEYYAIDNFLGYGQTETAGDNFYEKTLNNLKPIEGRVNIIKNDSVAESKNYHDNYFDIVYIDAEHGEQDVENDIRAWLPKVKKGGVICGDDYCEAWPGVILAVNKIFDNVNFAGTQQWYIQV